MNKKILKLITIVIIIICVVMNYSYSFCKKAEQHLQTEDGYLGVDIYSEAYGDDGESGYGFELTPGAFKTDSNKVETNDMQNIGAQIATIIRNVGLAITVIILMILGVKYMTGSIEQKAEYKKTMLPYVIGAGCLFGVSAIAQLVKTVAESLN